MPRDAFARFQIQKTLIALRVANRIEGDSASGALSHHVGGIVIIENMNESTKFQLKMVEIHFIGSSDDGQRNKGGGCTVCGWKHVAALNSKKTQF